MTYAKIKGNDSIQYPYGFGELQADNPHTNYSSSDVAHWFPLTEAATIEGCTLEPVTVLPIPEHSSATHTAVRDELPTLIDGVWTAGWTIVALEKSSDELATMRAAKQGAIEAEFQRRWQLPIAYSVGGQTYTFHGDQEAVDNISGIALLIACGVSIPNPRLWTPKDSFTAINITHAELIGLGATIAARKDALFTLKKAAQAEVAAMTDPVAIDTFDSTGCWG